MVPIREPIFFRISNHGMRNHLKPQTTNCAPLKMTTSNTNSTQTNTKENYPIQHIKLTVPQLGTTPPLKLQFTQLQQLGRKLPHEERLEFGQFVAREALLDEEFSTAAWLRAECHWEDQTNDRYINNYKRKFAEQELHALKRRRKKEPNSFCIVTVKKQDQNVKCTVVKSVVGTLDVSIRYLMLGETFPGERVRAPLFCFINQTEQIKYGYIANFCVSKSARRQGIATNMLSFAVKTAKAKGAERVFVHVYRNNKPAQELYQKMGFEVVERATAELSKERTYLLCLAL